MTNLYGRGKEPFWQQASTNLVKFVILLHQVLDDYVILFQVYEHVINPDKLRTRIQEGETRFTGGNRRIEIDRRELLFRPTGSSVTRHQGEGEGKAWTYWSREVEDSLVDPIASSSRCEAERPSICYKH
jgi:hypothetical protein